jgi:predicted transcriptional regulator
MATAISRPVSTLFWNDYKVSEYFTLEDKLFFLYLLTNEHVQQIGIYRITFRVMSFETGMTEEQIQESINHLEELDIIEYSYDTTEVAIWNYLKYSIISGKASNCYNNLERKVDNKELLKKLYSRLLKITDQRSTFQEKILPEVQKALNLNNNNEITNKTKTEEEDKELNDLRRRVNSLYRRFKEVKYQDPINCIEEHLNGRSIEELKKSELREIYKEAKQFPIY